MSPPMYDNPLKPLFGENRMLSNRVVSDATLEENLGPMGMEESLQENPHHRHKYLSNHGTVPWYDLAPVSSSQAPFQLFHDCPVSSLPNPRTLGHFFSALPPPPPPICSIPASLWGGKTADSFFAPVGRQGPTIFVNDNTFSWNTAPPYSPGVFAGECSPENGLNQESSVAVKVSKAKKITKAADLEDITSTWNKASPLTPVNTNAPATFEGERSFLNNFIKNIPSAVQDPKPKKNRKAVDEAATEIVPTDSNPDGATDLVTGIPVSLQLSEIASDEPCCSVHLWLDDYFQIDPVKAKAELAFQKKMKEVTLKKTATKTKNSKNSKKTLLATSRDPAPNFLYDLPMDVIANVLLKVMSPSTLANLAATCKSLKDLCYPELYRNVDLTCEWEWDSIGEDELGFRETEPQIVGNVDITTGAAQLLFIRTMTEARSSHLATKVQSLAFTLGLFSSCKRDRDFYKAMNNLKFVKKVAFLGGPREMHPIVEAGLSATVFPKAREISVVECDISLYMISKMIESRKTAGGSAKMAFFESVVHGSPKHAPEVLAGLWANGGKGHHEVEGEIVFPLPKDL